MLEINNAVKILNNNLILDNISFKVKAGSIVGIAGQSGSGKTTLLRCIQGLEKLDSGEIIFKGTSSFIFQDFQLFPNMSVFNNVAYALKVTLKDQNYKIKALELLNQLGLQDKANFFPNDLSGGQKQRVALARSLAMHPDLLLCDEPTSGLDAATTQEVLGLFKKVNSTGITILIASHDLDFLTKIADQILILKNSRIIADIETKNSTNLLQTLTSFIA